MDYLSEPNGEPLNGELIPTRAGGEATKIRIWRRTE